MAPPISVLLPALDAEATLPACLRSVVRQTFAKWECVVVDDGSTDGTARVVRAFARRDDRIRLLSIPHGGLVAALNAGLEACRGGLVARMDADDVMHRQRLEAQVAALASRPGWAAVGCHVRLFPRADLGAGYREYERWINRLATPEEVRCEAFVECPVAHPTLMMRRRRLGELGYRDRGWPEDYDLVLRLLSAGDQIGVVARRLLGWRHTTGRLSLTSPAYAIARFTACRAHFLARTFLAATPRYVLWGYGGTGRALRRALADLGKHPSHVVEVHGGRLGNRIHGALVVPPSELPLLPREPLVVSVAGRLPCAEVRRALAAMGLVESRDYVCAA